jgi:hypothetical protein
MDDLTPENMEGLSDEEKVIVDKIEAIRVGLEELAELLGDIGYIDAGQGIWDNARTVFLAEAVRFFITRDSARRGTLNRGAFVTCPPSRRYDYFGDY